MTPEVFLNQSESFLRTTSRLLKAKVEFKLAPDGLPMVCYNTVLSSCIISRVHDRAINDLCGVIWRNVSSDLCFVLNLFVLHLCVLHVIL